MFNRIESSSIRTKLYVFAIVINILLFIGFYIQINIGLRDESLLILLGIPLISLIPITIIDHQNILHEDYFPNGLHYRKALFVARAKMFDEFYGKNYLKALIHIMLFMISIILITLLVIVTMSESFIFVFIVFLILMFIIVYMFLFFPVKLFAMTCILDRMLVSDNYL